MRMMSDEDDIPAVLVNGREAELEKVERGNEGCRINARNVCSRCGSDPSLSLPSLFLPIDACDRVVGKAIYRLLVFSVEIRSHSLLQNLLASIRFPPFLLFLSFSYTRPIFKRVRERYRKEEREREGRSCPRNLQKDGRRTNDIKGVGLLLHYFCVILVSLSLSPLSLYFSHTFCEPFLRKRTEGNKPFLESTHFYFCEK